MTYVIASACIDVRDESCIAVCPVDCIHTSPDDRMCYIDPDVCIDCGVCVQACPVQAIFADKDLPEDGRVFLEVNAQWFDDKEAARETAASYATAGR